MIEALFIWLLGPNLAAVLLIISSISFFVVGLVTVVTRCDEGHFWWERKS